MADAERGETMPEQDVDLVIQCGKHRNAEQWCAIEGPRAGAIEAKPSTSADAGWNATSTSVVGHRDRRLLPILADR